MAPLRYTMESLFLGIPTDTSGIAPKHYVNGAKVNLFFNFVESFFWHLIEAKKQMD